MADSVQVSESVVLEFELAREDYIAYGAGHLARSQLNAQRVRMLRFGFPIVWLLVIALGGIEPWDWIWVALAVAWVAFVPKFLRRSIRKQVGRMATQGIARGYFGPHRFKVGPEGLEDAIEFGAWTTLWTGVERVVRTPKNVLIYIGANAAHVVPNRAFASEQELEGFVERVEQGLEAARGA